MRRRRTSTGDWIARFKDGKVPAYGCEDYVQLIGWMYFGETPDGLPEPDSPEALALIHAARPAFDEVLAEARVTVPGA